MVITLALMILLTILAVGLLSLSSVSLRSAAQGTAMASARANARFALMLALNDLQKNTGPDQRVTARAEILDSDPSTPAMDSVKQPYWTAAWPTGPAGLDITTSGTPQRTTSLGATSPTIAQKVASGHWLVSNPTPAGSPPLDPTSYPGTTTGATPQAVVVAKGQGAEQVDVAVPLVNIFGTVAATAAAKPGGRYAYWVSDEGLKAKVNLVDSTLAQSANSATGQAHFLAPQANAIHKIDALVSDPQKDFRSENKDDLGKTITTNTIGLLKTSPAGLKINTFLPDVTVYSRGVLADVKNGGLKKDLTAAFETPAGFAALATNYGCDKKTLYRNYPGLTVPTSSLMADIGAATYEGITDGLPWVALYAYYNIYKDTMAKPGPPTGGPIMNTASITPTSGGSLASLPYVVSPRVVTITEPVSGGQTSGKYGGLVPEVIAHRTDIALQSYRDPPDLTLPGVWKLRLRYCPQLVLYNPYNCRISSKNFRMQRNYFSFTDWHSGGVGSYKMTVTVGGAIAATNVLLDQAPMVQARRYSLETKAGQCDTLEPGETRVFGLEQDVPQPDLEHAINFLNVLTSGPNLTQDFAQYSDLPVGPTVEGTTSYTNGPAWPGTANGNDLVDLPIGLNPSFKQLTSGAADTSITPDNKWPCARGGRIFNTTGPQVDIPEPAPVWQPLPISSLTTPRILSGFFIRMKGVNPSSSTKTYTNGGAVIPPFHGNAPYFSMFENILSVGWHEFYINPFGGVYTSASEVQVAPSPSGFWETYVGGGSVGIPDATPSRRVLRDIPNQPLLSLGQFMHIPTIVFATDNQAMPGTYGRFGYRDAGSMFIGGSLANPFIPTTVNLMEENRSPNQKYFVMDDSFLANDTLFDRFFFSTVPPSSLNTNAPKQWSDFNSANTGASLKASPALPNSRIKPTDRNGTPPLMSDLRDFDKAAANLMLDGAFNVNSTSIHAWKAMLSSLSGNDLQVFKSASGMAGSISSTSLKNPIPRLWSSSNSGNVNGPWDGNRALSDTEVTELATRIVEQVKTRGPFLSMSDFLNRRLGPVGPLTRAGCLQAAIDTTSPNLNSAVKATGSAVTATGTGMGMCDSASPTYFLSPVIDANMKDGAGNPLNSTVGMPGYLMQQDIVQAFSPAMTVRSDTFVIRTYGESLSPTTGISQGKAWAEAVVQRVPEFVDATADPNPETALASLTSNTNKIMGRRFKVVGFRWLSPNEL